MTPKYRLGTVISLVLMAVAFISMNVNGMDSDESLKVLSDQLNQPMGIEIVDDLVYIADSYNNQVTLIKDGQTSVIAGKNDQADIFGFPLGGLVDGSVEEAYFNRPRDLVVTSEGIIYVADTDNHVIRKIDNGMVTTFAGTGQAGYANGNGSEAQFNKPSSILIDHEGNLVVTDMLNNKIRLIDHQGNVSTLEVSSDDQSHLLNEPSDLVMVSENDYVLVDSGHQLIKRIVDGKVTVISGLWNGNYSGDYGQVGYMDGEMSQAMYNFPKSLTAYDGIIYVADTWNHCVRMIKPDGTVTTLVGSGSPGNAYPITDKALNGPSGLEVHDGVLYISDRYNNRIVSVELNYGMEVYDLTIEDFTDVNSDLVEVRVEGEAVRFTDVKPSFIEDLYYYPVRAIGESLGMTVSYDQESRKASLVSNKVSHTYSIDDERGTIINNRFMMPIRDIASDLSLFLSVNDTSGDIWISQPSAQ